MVSRRFLLREGFNMAKQDLTAQTPTSGPTPPAARGSEAKEDTSPPFEQWAKHHLRFGRCDDTVIIFVPSHKRNKDEIANQAEWASTALNLLGELYGGATGFPDLSGVWRDDDDGGKLLDDRPIMVQAIARRSDVENVDKLKKLGAFLRLLGKETKQGAVAVVLNDAIHFVSKYDEPDAVTV
jgi:hypothetical protein